MRIGTLKHRYTGRKRFARFRDQSLDERIAIIGGGILSLVFAIAYLVIIVGEMGWAR